MTDRAGSSLVPFTDPQVGEVWISRDPRDEGLRVEVLKVDDGYVTYKRFNVRRVRLERFKKGYRRG